MTNRPSCRFSTDAFAGRLGGSRGDSSRSTNSSSSSVVNGCLHTVTPTPIPTPAHAHNPGADAWSAAASDSLLSLTAAPAVVGGRGRGREGGFTDLAAKKNREKKPEMQRADVHLDMWTPTSRAPTGVPGLQIRPHPPPPPPAFRWRSFKMTG